MLIYLKIIFVVIIITNLVAYSIFKVLAKYSVSFHEIKS